MPIPPITLEELLALDEPHTQGAGAHVPSGLHGSAHSEHGGEHHDPTAHTVHAAHAALSASEMGEVLAHGAHAALSAPQLQGAHHVSPWGWGNRALGLGMAAAHAGLAINQAQQGNGRQARTNALEGVLDVAGSLLPQVGAVRSVVDTALGMAGAGSIAQNMTATDIAEQGPQARLEIGQRAREMSQLNSPSALERMAAVQAMSTPRGRRLVDYRAALGVAPPALAPSPHVIDLSPDEDSADTAGPVVAEREQAQRAAAALPRGPVELIGGGRGVLQPLATEEQLPEYLRRPSR